MLIPTMSISVLLVVPSIASAAAATSCDVSRHGAQGGGADDTAVLQGILDDPACAEVLFPAGRKFAASVLFVRRSDVVLTLEANATLSGLPAAFVRDRPDCATEAGLEFNWTSWCALLRVESAANFTLRGTGTIAPGGIGGASPDFYSAVHVSSTVGVSLSEVTIHCTAWWWCTVLHNASFVAVSRLFVDGFDGRDGLDMVNCRHVLVEDSRIEGSDDALCFKTISNDGLAAHPSFNVTVRRSMIASRWCNAIQFGSATEVDMHGFTIEDVRITSARKAAIGIVSMDGANISAVLLRNVTIDGRASIATPLFVKIGSSRARAEPTIWPVPASPSACPPARRASPPLPFSICLSLTHVFRSPLIPSPYGWQQPRGLRRWQGHVLASWLHSRSARDANDRRRMGAREPPRTRPRRKLHHHR